MATTKKTAKKTTPKYTASLVTMGRKYEGKGKDVASAILDLKIDGIVKTKAIITVSNGTKSKERVLLPANINRIFSLSPLMQEVQLKQISQLFDL